VSFGSRVPRSDRRQPDRSRHVSLVEGRHDFELAADGGAGGAGVDAGALVAEGEGTAGCGEGVGEADAVFSGLDFDGGERDAGFLGFDDAYGETVDIEEIVGETVAFFEGEFADGDALG